MRSFSSLEKNILRDISIQSYTKSNVMDLLSKHALVDKGLILDFNKNTIRFLVPLTQMESIGEIFEAVYFILYLEKENLIYLHSNYQNLATEEVCISHNIDQKFIDEHEKELGIQPVPTNFIEKVKKLHNSYIIPTTQLRDLVKNDFKSYEQLRHEKELGIAKWSFGIAFLGLIVALAVPFIFDSSLDNNQFKLLIETIDKK